MSNAPAEVEAQSLRVFEDPPASEPFLGSSATPKAQSLCGDSSLKLPGSSEKGQDAKQALATGVQPGTTSQSPAEAKANAGAFLHVLLAACIASLGGILFGYDSGIISGALLQVREIFDLPCVVQQLVVGSLFLSAFVSSFFGGILVDYIGRKRALLLASVFFLSGAAVQSMSVDLTMLVCGRFVTGVAVSLSTTAVCTYIAEISPAVHRGLLMSLKEVGITVGFLLAYTVNYAFISYANGWQFMFAAAMCPALLMFLGTLCLPQSPHFLVLKGRQDEAHKVLTVIHGKEAASQELSRMHKSLMEEKTYRYRDLFAPGLRGRMIVGVGLVVLQQCTGQTNVIYYAPTLLKHLGFCTNVAATLASVGLGVVKVAASLFALLLLDRLGRRVCLCSGVLLMGVSIFALGMLAKFSYGGSGQVIALRCRDRSNAFNTSMYRAYVTAHSDTTATTLPLTSVSPRSESRRSRRENTPDVASSSASIPLRMVTEPSKTLESLLTIKTSGRPNHADRSTNYHVRTAPPPSQASDTFGRPATGGVADKPESWAVPQGRDAGPDDDSRDIQHQFRSDEDPVHFELLPAPAGDNAVPTMGAYSLNNPLLSNDLLGKVYGMRESSNGRPLPSLSAVKSTDTGSTEISTPPYAAVDNEHHWEAEESSDSRTVVSAANEESQCSGVPQGSPVQRALTLSALMCYVFAYGVGFGTTTWLILSEIFPAAVRGRAIAIATSANWAANVCVSASFLTVLDTLGVGDTLLMYSGVCFLAVCFIFLCVPETKHKTLEEITVELDQGLIRWNAILPARWSSASDYTLRNGSNA
ncbi:solute carrier family 2, facilitated glucose transporter member 10-like isoform X2 [Haemaphysalis longicornis]